MLIYYIRHNHQVRIILAHSLPAQLHSRPPCLNILDHEPIEHLHETTHTLGGQQSELSIVTGSQYCEAYGTRDTRSTIPAL